MQQRSPLAGLRLGLTYGAGLVILGLVAAAITAPTPRALVSTSAAASR